MSVFLGYLHPNDYAASFGRSLMDLIMFDMSNGKHLRQWGAIRCAPYSIPEGRNELADKLLKSDCEWLLQVDADMGFQAYALEQLMAVAKENKLLLLGGLCFAYREHAYDGMNGLRHHPLPTIYDFIDGEFKGRTHYPVNTLIPTAATGCAMLLTHRSIFEAIQKEFGDVWFDRLEGPSGKLWGEDISFFHRANTLGFQAYVHTGIRTNHQKTIWVSETDYWNSFHAPPATEPVDVIVPTVTPRSGNIPALAESLKASTGLARLLLIVDDEDHAAELKQWGETVIQPGSFAVKINAAYPHTTAAWIQVVGDDCRFHPGWLDQQQLIARLYGAKVVGSNDQANPRVIKGEHATHWMIARDYIDEVGSSWDGPGVVAHEGYKHWFVDDEIVTAAKIRGVFQSAQGAVIEHFHPIAGKAPVDEVYEKNDRHAALDKRLFMKRLALNKA